MRLRALGLAVLLAACGARTPLGTRDGGASGGSAQDAGADAPPIGVECTWSLTGPPVRVSADPVEVPGDVRLEDAVPTTGGALVAWVTPGDKMHAQTAVARLVAFDLASNGDEHVVLRAPDVVSALRDVSLGEGFGHVGVTAWTGSRCVLRPITLDGASNGSMIDVASTPCEGLEATAPGFDLLIRPGTELHVLPLDPSGAPLGPGAFLLGAGPGTLGAVGRATLGDGSFEVAATFDGERVMASHRDSHGAPIGNDHLVSTSTNLVPTLLSIAPVTGGAMVSWVELDGVSARVAVNPIDVDGAPLGGRLLAASSAVSITAMDLAPDVTGGALLAWTEYGPPTSSVRLQALSAAGTPRGAPLVVPEPVPGARFGPGVHVVTAGKQGLVLLEAFSDTTLHRVYAAPLACAP